MSGALGGYDRLLAVHVGIDLAMSYDWTAVCVSQVRERMRQTAEAQAIPSGAWWLPASTLTDALRQAVWRNSERYYRVQAITRWPHNMELREQKAAVVRLVARLSEELQEERVRRAGTVDPYADVAVFADATGLGKPITAEYKSALKEDARTARVPLQDLTIAHGVKYQRGRKIVGKTHLVANLQALFATDRVELPAHDPEMPRLRQEIDAYRIAISRDGVETFGAMSTSHDDMVTALALAVLDDPASRRVSVGPSFF